SRTARAKAPAPRSGRSSLLTEVITTCLSPMAAAMQAILPASPGSGGEGCPLSTAQKRHLRVQDRPRIKKVAVGLEKHSAILGQRASSQTVARHDSRRHFLVG